ncbi:nickel ABC transporter substrate-binding protein [Helicobacter bilis]|uniref:nickel ABC transporter substrate-binding protein n=1 Tax=Helicobacter bilis TaxID=37372 RepID=UPI0026EEDA90|nr:nickel ABC transporter substrate-binding protein [Helicobacter bilis]MCI7411365.1 nickel ABC transporter substrate-binding protein [Helicobacter bilis]MDD7296995.1 nickel ABC transporter substrate-binding protein [Helicobacter bilis]MDY4400879.1 nickel ABC transporter substrate-binding protein [Helicobacter bilis]
MYRILLPLLLLCSFHYAFAENILRVAVSQNVGDMNPQGYNLNQLYAQNMIYEGLVKTDSKGNITPSLALSWEVKDSGKSYIFHLRKNVLFSNGESFNAQAVVKNFQSILKNKARHSWSALVMTIDSVVALDDYAIKLTLKHPYIATLNELALVRPFRFIAPSMIPQDLDLAKNNPKKPIGTGPYMLTDTKVGISNTFSKNPHYWDKARYNGIYYDTIITKIIIDPNAKLVALKTKQVDMIYGSDSIPIEIFHNIAETKQFQTFLSPPAFTTFLIVNPASKTLQDKNMREALALSIDKAKIIESVYYGYQKEAQFLFNQNLPFTKTKSYTPLTYNKDKALNLLAKMGYTKKSDGYLYKDNKELQVQLHFIANNPTQKAIATIMQAQLKDIGIFLELIPNEVTMYRKKQTQGQFELCFSQTWGVPYEPFTFINSMRHKGHADYMAQVALPKTDSINKDSIDKAIKTLIESPYDIYADSKKIDSNKAQENLAKQTQSFLDMLYSTQIYIPLTYDTNKVVARAGIKGIAPDVRVFEIPFWEFYE